MRVILIRPIFLLAGILFFSILSIPQDFKSKLKNLKGEAQKITIKTSKGEFTFEGEDAKSLMKKIKMNKIDKNVKVFMNNQGDSTKKLKEFSIEDNDSDEFEITYFDDKDSKSIKKEIKIEESDSGKKIEVKTNEGGAESVKIYEGKEADEYLQKMKKDEKFKMDWKDKSNKKKMIIIEKDIKE